MNQEIYEAYKERIKGWKKCIATNNPSTMDYEMLAKTIAEAVPEKDICGCGNTIICECGASQVNAFCDKLLANLKEVKNAENKRT